MYIKNDMNEKELRNITKEEKTLFFVEFLKENSSKDDKFESMVYMETLFTCELRLPLHFFGTKTTRSTMIKRIAWFYNTNRDGYLMKPEYWAIVYDELLEYYENNKENKEMLYFSTAKNFGKGQHISNLYYNQEAPKILDLLI